MTDSQQERRGRYAPSLALLQRYLTVGENSTETQERLESAAEVFQNINVLLTKIAIKDGEKGAHSTSRRVRHLNDLAKVIRHVGPNAPDVIINARRIIENVRLALLSSVKEIRAGALRVFRYLLSSPVVFQIMLHFQVDYLVARSLDSPPLKDIERLQAMRFVRQVLMVCPHLIPRSLIAPLVSIVASDIEPVDNLTWAALATLSEIALVNIQLASECGVIKVLVRGILKCQMASICETVILTLCHLSNLPQTRKFVRSHLDIEGVLAPITDLHFNYHTSDGSDPNHSRMDRVKKVESAKMCITALLKSFPGFLLLFNPSSTNNGAASSIVNMLPLVDSYIQREILLILYNAFHLKVPEWTEDYRIAIASIDPTQYCQDWSLEEGWVAEEGKSLLPPKVMERVNLMDCYHALLLTCLLNVGLIHSLVDVVKKSEQSISVMAAVLIGELLHMSNSILPPEYFCFSLTLPDLVASAMLPHEQSERNRASEVINCLDRIHQLKKQLLKPSSLYLKLTLEQTGYLSGRSNSSTSHDLMHSVHISTEMDEFTLQAHIRDTSVLTSTREYVSWSWNLILSLLHHPYMYTVPLTEDNMYTKFLRVLTNFYKPSCRQFSSINYSLANSKRYSTVGLQLIKYLSKMEGGGSGLLYGLVKDIVDQLGQVTVSKVTADVFSPSSVSHRMARDYFLFLGAVSFHNSSLLQHCGAYGPFLDICSIASRHDLHKLIISSLDFAHDTHSRVILQKLLTGGDVETRLYSTRHMRVFLRVNAPFFINWGMEMLIGQLYDTEQEVAEEAIDILDEACEEESFLEALVLQHPALLHLSEKGVSLLTRFISVKRGYSLLSRLGHLQTELDAWLQDYNFRYVSVVEQRLAESLTCYRQTKEGEYHRRTDHNNNLRSLKAIVPVHFYSQLVRHEEGCSLLNEEGHIKKLMESLQKEPANSSDIKQIKAAVWALGHIGTSNGGLELLLKDSAIEALVAMAENSPVLSIRGSCFYSLCLISKTPSGADCLLSMGWASVRHSSEEKWPLILSETIENITTPSSPLSPTSSFSHILPGGGGGASEMFSGDSSPHSLTSIKSSPSLHEESKKGRSSSLYKTNSTGARNYIRRPVRPVTLDKDSPGYYPESPVKKSSRSYPVFTAATSGRLNSISSTGVKQGGFVGVALPLELNALLTFDEGVFEGSRVNYISTEIFDDEHHFLLDVQTRSHTADIDMEFSPKSDVASSEVNGEQTTPTLVIVDPTPNTNATTAPENIDTVTDSRQLGTSVHSQTSVSSGSVVFDERSLEGQLLLHREFLEVVYFLCSDVSLRKNTFHLNILCNKFPSLSQDVNLYWKTMTLISLYPYTLTNRRLIQSKFEHLTFDQIFTDTRQYYKTKELQRSDDSPGSSSRRRNSTGEILKRHSNSSGSTTTLPVGSGDKVADPAHHYISHSEERLDTHSMRSMATNTTASELDTLSEGEGGSLTSNDQLDWVEEELGKEEVELREEEKGAAAVETVVQVDDTSAITDTATGAGNRLSQLELVTDSSCCSTDDVTEPVSMVEVVIDL